MQPPFYWSYCIAIHCKMATKRGPGFVMVGGHPGVAAWAPRTSRTDDSSAWTFWSFKVLIKNSLSRRCRDRRRRRRRRRRRFWPSSNPRKSSGGLFFTIFNDFKVRAIVYERERKTEGESVCACVCVCAWVCGCACVRERESKKLPNQFSRNWSEDPK